MWLERACLIVSRGGWGVAGEELLAGCVTEGGNVSRVCGWSRVISGVCDWRGIPPPSLLLACIK